MPPRTAVAAAAPNSLAASTRARQDPKRRIGNGNAVAGGLDLTRVGVLSDRELAYFQRLAYAGSHSAEQQQQQHRAAEEQRRRELSKARTANWPDTIEARQERFLRAQQDAKDAAEERQRVLDDLYAEQLKEEQQAMLARQELQQLSDDPRGRNARSMQLLHETLKEREQQVAYRQHIKAQEAADVADTQRQLQLQAWGDQAEALHKRLEKRERNMAEKNANLETVLYQIDERRQERAAERQERQRILQEAAEEREEQAAEEAARQAREHENGAYNVAHSRTALTKAQKLQERLAEHAQDDAVLRAEEAKQEGLKTWVRDRQAQKQEAFERRRQAGMQHYLEEANPERAPTHRTQQVFEQKGQSFLQRMHDGDVQRQEGERQYRSQLRQQRQEEEEEAERAQEGGGAVPAWRSSSGNNNNNNEGGAAAAAASSPSPQPQKAPPRRHGAATTAGGFLNAEEEKAYVEEMRRHPAQLKAEQAAEAAARRAEAQRIAEIQKMQAAEKRENARRAVEARREEARLQQERSAQEDAQYSAYIDTIVPEDMHPVLYRKAKQLQ